MSTTAHFHVIHEASAHRAQSRRDVGPPADTALAGSARDRVLHAIAGEDFEASVIELHGNVDRDFARGALEHFAQPFVETQLFSGVVEARLGGEPGIGLLLARQHRHWFRPPDSWYSRRGAAAVLVTPRPTGQKRKRWAASRTSRSSSSLNPKTVRAISNSHVRSHSKTPGSSVFSVMGTPAS